MADWSGGYSVEWVVARVNPDTWEDDGVVENAMPESVSRDSADSSPLLETGSIVFDGGEFESAWLRVYMIVHQGGVEKHAITTQLFEKASSEFNRSSSIITANGRSVLQPAADRKMTRGAFAAKGSDGAARAASLIAECTPAPVSVEGSFTLSDNVVFDLGCSYLDAAWMLLDAGEWCIQIDGTGEIHVRPKPAEPALELSTANAGILIPGTDEDYSIIDVPNRFYAISDGDMAVATVDDDSPLGIASRGRWVDCVEEAPTLIDGESLEAYAKRRLREETTITRTYTYKREWVPDVMLYDIVRSTAPDNGIDGDLRIMRQELRCENGIELEETSGREIEL